MITLFYRTSNPACRQAVNWFEQHGIKICQKKINEMSECDLVHCLALSEKGFDSVLKQHVNTYPNFLEQLKELKEMSFQKGIEFILEHNDLLKAPIIVDNTKLVVGYNTDNIRVFLSTEYRNLEII